MRPSRGASRSRRRRSSRRMREAGLVVAARCGPLRRGRGSRASAPPNWTPSPSGGSAAPAPSRRSWATTASPPRSAPRSTTRSCTASRRRHGVLREGDVISIDCGAIVDGWHGDAALTVGGGRGQPGRGPRCSPRASGRSGTGLAAGRAGARLSDISHAVERTRARAGAYGIVEEYVGPRHRQRDAHGPAGAQLRPAGPRAAARRGHGAGHRADAGARQPETRLLDDGWTVVSEDGSCAAHFEHTVAITADGPWVLTAPPRTAARPVFAASRAG